MSELLYGVNQFTVALANRKMEAEGSEWRFVEVRRVEGVPIYELKSEQGRNQMLTRIEVCCNCRFWKYGLCKRHAPVAMALSVEVTGSEFHADQNFVTGSVTRYPETNHDDWCGDFELREKSDGRD